MPDLPDYYVRAAMAWSEISAIIGGLDASKSATPAVKDVYLATDTNKLYVCYTAGVWTDVTHACLLLAGGTMTGAINMGANKITNLGAPTAANDAVRKAYADLFTLLTAFNDHSARHENGGADEISVAGLSGALADAQTPAAHNLGGAKHNADTLAHLNAKISDATLDDSGASRTPSAHAASHQDTGADEISIEGLAGAPAQKAAASGLASLNASSKVVEQPASISDFLEATPTDGESGKAADSDWAHDHAADKSAHHSNILSLTFIIDGGGATITTGQKGHLRIPFACTISRVTMLADRSGSIQVDIWKDTYANFPPIPEDSICAAALPTITTAQKSEDSTLTDWTTAITADDILAFNVESVTDIWRVTISLKVAKT